MAAHPAAVIFALSMAVWVADVRLAPSRMAHESVAPVAACEAGPSASSPPDADAELVVCGSRLVQ
ncbi:MAG TPA: hypothetical protein VHV51_24500 [Polyangiaceae bacterium]|jgi:hypothetical protein|nr:hypothetical protein [Polyangiaceae bacterium]